MIKYYFSKAFDPEGRVTRKDWWLGLLISWGSIFLLLILSVLTRLFNNPIMNIVPFIIFILVMYFIIAQITHSVRRIHDIGSSGWFLLISLIPIIGVLILFVMLGFIKGNIGKNKYDSNHEI